VTCVVPFQPGDRSSSAGQNGLMVMTQDGDTDTLAEQRNVAARRIAEELQLDPGQHRMAKVSSLLHAFRGQGGHCDIGDMKRALSDQGVIISSSDAVNSRRDVMDLCLRDTEPAATPPAQTGIRVSRWRTQEAGRPQALDEDLDLGAGTEDAILWFDVDSPRGEPSAQLIHEVTSRLAPWCPGLNQVMVRDLVTPDTQPKSETYGDERTGVRTVSIPALIARQVHDEADKFDSTDEQLIVQLVEVVVGPGWMITCWHPSRTLSGSGVVSGPPLLREPFLDHVVHRWLHDPADLSNGDRAKEVSDLAVYLARSLVATYGASLRTLQRWVSEWEVSFYKTLGDQDRDERAEREASRNSLKDAAVEIGNFLSVVGEFSRSVNAFRLAGDEMPNETWFAEPTGSPQEGVPTSSLSERAKALETSVEAAAEKLTQLYDEIRADMDLLMIQSQARQQESAERLQGYLGKVTGLILVPTFVAGLFGANTALPGQGSWSGFELMLVLMVLSALASYWVIRRLIR
jgi:Mg2+ and Co2+ transporter CorA